MAAFAITGMNGGSFGEDYLHPGDTFICGEIVDTVTNTAAVTLAAANFLNGVLVRTGQSGAVSDVLDSAYNFLTALSGGNLGSQPVVEKGTTFRCRIMNTGGSTITLTATTAISAGITLATGVFTIAAGYWRDLLFTVQSATLPDVLQVNATSGSPNYYFVLPAGQASMPILPAGGGLGIDLGATVDINNSGTAVTVTGLIHGQGGLIGFVASANAASSGVMSASFTSSMKVDSIGSGLV